LKKNFQVREKIPGYPEEATPRCAPGSPVVRRQRGRHPRPGWWVQIRQGQIYRPHWRAGGARHGAVA